MHSSVSSDWCRKQPRGWGSREPLLAAVLDDAPGERGAKRGRQDDGEKTRKIRCAGKEWKREVRNGVDEAHRSNEEEPQQVVRYRVSVYQSESGKKVRNTSSENRDQHEGVWSKVRAGQRGEVI